MKKQSTLKAKKIHNHAPNASNAYSCMKYDRNFVRGHMSDVSVLPMSRGSRRAGNFIFPYENPNVNLWRYLKRYMQKQVGRKFSDVFSDFKRLGWKSTYEMYYYWDAYVSKDKERCAPWDYYPSEDGIFKQAVE